MVWGLVVWESLLQRGFGYLVLSGSSGVGVEHQEQVEREAHLGFPRQSLAPSRGSEAVPPLSFSFPLHTFKF